jgi:hypothetical protein
VVMPAFPALLPDAARKELSDLRPILRSVFLHRLDELMVLCIQPGTLDHLRVEDLLPAVEALDVSSIIKMFSNTFPVLASKSVY